jgi:hypothetical protein
MQHYRITKYDPARRDLCGAFPSGDWTSRSDIGRVFNDVTLTEEQYVAVENAYLKAAATFLKEAGVGELTIVGLENRAACTKAPSNGDLVLAEAMPTVLRSLLREEYWCKLEGASAFVHVGWDYYMYIGVPAKCPAAESVARDLDLFVEQMRSPYAEDEA